MDKNHEGRIKQGTSAMLLALLYRVVQKPAISGEGVTDTICAHLSGAEKTELGNPFAL
jgi:hypothetical protein